MKEFKFEILIPATKALRDPTTRIITVRAEDKYSALSRAEDIASTWFANGQFATYSDPIAI